MQYSWDSRLHNPPLWLVPHNHNHKCRYKNKCHMQAQYFKLITTAVWEWLSFVSAGWNSLDTFWCISAAEHTCIFLVFVSFWFAYTTWCHMHKESFRLLYLTPVHTYFVLSLSLHRKCELVASSDVLYECECEFMQILKVLFCVTHAPDFRQ